MCAFFLFSPLGQYPIKKNQNLNIPRRLSIVSETNNTRPIMLLLHLYPIFSSLSDRNIYTRLVKNKKKKETTRMASRPMYDLVYFDFYPIPFLKSLSRSV